MKPRVIVSATALATVLAVPALAAQADYFLKIDCVEGESVDNRHGGEIEILSWSWGVDNPATLGSGGAAGKRQHKPITIVKEWGALDAAAGQLQVRCRAIQIEALLGAGKIAKATPTPAMRPGICPFVVPLPDANPRQVQIRASIPGLAGGPVFQAALFSGEVSAGQTLVGKLSAQHQGEGALLALRWAVPGPPARLLHLRGKQTP